MHLITLLSLLLGLVLSYECADEANCVTDTGEGLEAAWNAYKRLFECQIELSDAKALQLLDALEPYIRQDKFASINSLTDLSRLSEFKEPTGAFCVNEEQVLRLQRALFLVKRRHRAAT